MKSIVLWVMVGVAALWYLSRKKTTQTVIVRQTAQPAQQVSGTQAMVQNAQNQAIAAGTQLAQTGLAGLFTALAGGKATSAQINANGSSNLIGQGTSSVFGGATSSIVNQSASNPDSGYDQYSFSGGGSPSESNVSEGFFGGGSPSAVNVGLGSDVAFFTGGDNSWGSSSDYGVASWGTGGDSSGAVWDAGSAW